MASRISSLEKNGRQMAMAWIETGRSCYCPRDSVRAQLLHGVVWNVAGSVAQQGGSFVAAVLVARILGKQAFGQFALIQSSLIALTTMASLALGVTATKYVSEYRASQPEKAGRILGLASLCATLAASVIATALIAGSGNWIPGVAAEESLIWGARIGAVYVFFITLNGYQLGAVAGFEAFRTMGRISIAYGGANLLLSGTLASVAGLRGAVAAQALSAFLLWAVYSWALRRKCREHGIRIDRKHAWRERGVLWHFSLPGAWSGVVASAAMWWCNAYLVRTSGYAEMAVFSAVNNMRSMVLFLPAIVSRVATPLLNRLRSNGRHSTYRRTFLGAIAVNAGVASCLAIVLSLTGRTVLGLFGRDFSGSALLVVALLGAGVLEVIGTSLFQALFSSGRIWRNLCILCLWACVLVTAIRFTIGPLGAAGLAVSYLLAWTLASGVYALSVWSRT